MDAPSRDHSMSCFVDEHACVKAYAEMITGTLTGLLKVDATSSRLVVVLRSRLFERLVDNISHVALNAPEPFRIRTMQQPQSVKEGVTELR
jgi:hypothetical protein